MATWLSPERFAAYFWSRVEKDGPVPAHRPDLGPCWMWTGGSMTNSGDGRVMHNGKRDGAHRVSWELAHGPIPPGMWVLHHCDVPGCVNPAHHFLGTQTENMADASKKGRLASGDRNGARKYPERRVSGPAWADYLRARLPRGDQHWVRRHPERMARGEDGAPPG